RLVTPCQHHAALGGKTHDHRTTAQLRPVVLLDRSVEGVHVHVENSSHARSLIASPTHWTCLARPRNLAPSSGNGMARSRPPRTLKSSPKGDPIRRSLRANAVRERVPWRAYDPLCSRRMQGQRPALSECAGARTRIMMSLLQ